MINLLLFPLCLAGIACLLSRRVPLGAPLLACSVVVLASMFSTNARPGSVLPFGAVLAAYLTALQFPKISRKMVSFYIAILLVGAAYSVIRDGDMKGGELWRNEYAALVLLAYGLLPTWLLLPALFLTGCRSAVLGVLGAGVLHWRKWWMIAGLFVVGIALLFLRPLTVGIRLENWRVAFELLKLSPWTGYGVGSTYTLFKLTHLDSLPVTLLLEFGVLGILPFLWLLWEIILLITRINSPHKHALTAFLLMHLAEAPLYFLATAIPFGVILGLAHDDTR